MFAPARRHCLHNASHKTIASPIIVSPRVSSSRPFSSTPQCHSKIGGAPLSIPPEVSFSVIPPTKPKRGRMASGELKATVAIKGPLGELSLQIPPYVEIEQSEARAVLRIQDHKIRQQREMWGTTRAYLQNYILGVSEGHTAILRLVGVGYRATIESTATTVSAEYPDQQFVNLKVGYSHPIELGVPKGVKASVPQPTRILLEGVDKEVVMQFAAEIREWRKPEPYKGKGIFVNDETIRLKSKKVK
ncbi:mitochondrial 54S ribosomal protein YmL16 [Aulographum hederae CBS 113979]|uniref:Mitochondrial 54S ribosomal protein YmL16 n=1 Tax=Aulographum hederae CBS 113979 TaxID=1176131 RepID=A0A6G1GM07_9PEZI|nr:mitochondrial 54S ribosomal protein YmL16 [Aulographum hederae CBS 113979]